METVKSYKIPVEAPKDLIEEYFKVKQKALDIIFSHVKFSGKAHLKFNREDRRKLRDELLREWKYSKHYVDSAINSIIGLIKSWITLYNGGKAESKLEITKRTVYIKNTLFSFRNGFLKISIEPSKRYLEVDLSKYSWIPKDFDRVGGLILTEKELIITVKKNVEPKAEKWPSFDVNLTNVTAFIDEVKRQRIQKLSKIKPLTSKKLLEKYSRREKNRAKDFMHKLTTQMVRELKEKIFVVSLFLSIPFLLLVSISLYQSPRQLFQALLQAYRLLRVRPLSVKSQYLLRHLYSLFSLQLFG
ncbi:MAG: hypothetical protein QW382_06810 [Nitrososphaerota archaeon]